MAGNIENWVEQVREKPEHVRRRYVFICVAVSMALIFGVWLLTVTESFRTVSSETGKATDGARNILPKPSNFSLDQFLKGNKSLGGEKENMSGQEYYQNQAREKEQQNFNDEGVEPVQGGTSAPSQGQ